MRLSNQNIRHVIINQACVLLASVLAGLFISIFQYNISIFQELKNFNRELRALKNTINLFCLEIDQIHQDYQEKLEDKHLYALLERYETMFSLQKYIFQNSDYKLFFTKANCEILGPFSKKHFSFAPKESSEFVNTNFKWGIAAKGDSLFLIKKVLGNWGGSIGMISIQFIRPSLLGMPKNNVLLVMDKKDNFYLLSPISFQNYVSINYKEILIYFMIFFLSSFLIANIIFLHMRRSGLKKLYDQEVINNDLNKEIAEISNSYYTLLQIESFYRDKYINDLKQEIKFFPKNKKVYSEIITPSRICTALTAIEPSIFDILNQKIEPIASLIKEVVNLLEWQAKRKGIAIDFVLGNKEPFVFESSHKFIQAIIFVVIDALLRDCAQLRQITLSINMKYSNLNISIASNGEQNTSLSLTDLVKLLKKYGVDIKDKSSTSNVCIELIVVNEKVIQEKVDIGNSNIVNFPKK